MPERPMSMEMPGPAPHGEGAPESKEARESETIRRSFEYHDADGKLLGVAEVALAAETTDMPYANAKDGAAAKGRKLLSFVLRGEKDGKPTELDLLALANRHGVEVVSADERLVNYEYSDDKKRAVVPPLETPLDVGVFMHELGHADQFHEDRFEKITPLYGRSRQAGLGDLRLSFTSMRELLDAVTEAVPEASIALDHEGMRQLETIEARRHAALDEKAAFEKRLDERERLRNEALGGLLVDAMGRERFDGMVARCAEIAASEGSGPPPLHASPAVEGLVEELKRAGIAFLEQAANERPGEEPSEGGGFAAERPQRHPLLSERAITSASQVADLLHQMMSDPDAAAVDVRYDGDAEELLVLAPFTSPGAHANVAGRFPLDRETFERYARGRAADDREVRHLEQRADRTYEDARDYGRAQELLMQHIDVRAIAALPTKMMERDATRRALQWLRAVRRDSGVDLLAAHLVPPEALVASGRAASVAEGCVGSVAAGMESGREEGIEATVLEDLKRALATYGADKFRIRPPDDDGIGIAPIAGLDRTKKP